MEPKNPLLPIYEDNEFVEDYLSYEDPDSSFNSDMSFDCDLNSPLKPGEYEQMVCDSQARNRATSENEENSSKNKENAVLVMAPIMAPLISVELFEHHPRCPIYEEFMQLIGFTVAEEKREEATRPSFMKRLRKAMATPDNPRARLVRQLRICWFLFSFSIFLFCYVTRTFVDLRIVSPGDGGYKCYHIGEFPDFPRIRCPDANASAPLSPQLLTRNGGAPLATTLHTLLDLHKSIEVRAAKHSDAICISLTKIKSGLATLVQSLDSASEEMAFVRSVITQNAFGIEECGLECSKHVAAYLRHHDFVLGGEKDLLWKDLQELDDEMTEYYHFLSEVKKKFFRITDELKTALVYDSETSLVNDQKTELINDPKPKQLPFNHDKRTQDGPYSLVVHGDFNIGESHLQHSRERVVDAIVQAAQETSLHTSSFSTFLTKNLLSLPPSNYDGERLWYCQYIVGVGVEVDAMPAVQSLNCNLEV